MRHAHDCGKEKMRTRHMEKLRYEFKPNTVTVLFVGESRPDGKTFFYKRDSLLYHAMEECFSTKANFLLEFQAKGFFLDDLVLHPVNHIKDKRNRTALRRKAVPSLAHRMAAYRPSAVVALMCAIEPMVRDAMNQAGLQDVPLYVTPFPNHWNRTRFKTTMAEIIPKLPSTNVSAKDP